jgi:hypothetical protein
MMDEWNRNRPQQPDRARSERDDDDRAGKRDREWRSAKRRSMIGWKRDWKSPSPAQTRSP